MMMKAMKKMRKRRRRRTKAPCGRELLKRRMKLIPRGRRQKMGLRHEPLPAGLGMGGPSGPGGGAGTHKSSLPLLLAPCSGPAPRAVTLVLPPSLSLPSLQTLLLHPHCHRSSS